jgi:hypothetical protein
MSIIMWTEQSMFLRSFSLGMCYGAIWLKATYSAKLKHAKDLRDINELLERWQKELGERRGEKGNEINHGSVGRPV